MKPGYPAVKRAFDVLASSGLLIVTLPVQAILAVVVAATMGRPVVFTQDRPGLHGEVFRMHKFRTMKQEAYPGQPDAERMTTVGSLLRSTSLDELPELWDVLRGKMSLVGPRPLLVEYLEHYSPRQARRHEVRPGVTGLAQVTGRNALSWDEQFELDVQYVERLSWRQDLDILCKTIFAVLKRSNVNQPGEATRARFTGSAEGSA